jgi:hypothetical protein
MLVLTPVPPPPPLDCNKQLKKLSVMAAGKGCGDGKDGSGGVGCKVVGGGYVHREVITALTKVLAARWL